MTELLVGRTAEVRHLRRLADEAGLGHATTATIRGCAGSGKSALLWDLHRYATSRDFLALMTAGVESEREFPFAALQLLLRPVARHAQSLSAGHRRVLEAAFGSLRFPDSPAGPGSVERVGAAALAMLTEAAGGRPLLLLADDLPLTDTASRDVLAFLGEQDVCVVGTARTGQPAPTGGTDLHLGPLDDEAASALLDSRAPDLPASVRELILDLAAGNPLALSELPTTVSGDPGEEIMLTQPLQDAFASRADQMSDACRNLLLILAAEPDAHLDQLLAVADRPGTAGSGTAEALQEAIDAELLSATGSTLEFRHPLMRTAIYSRATLTDRLAVHRSLAMAFAGAPCAEKELFHRAKGSLGADPELAARLEQFAGTALTQDRPGTAVAALRHAAKLVPDGQHRTAVLIRAAGLAAEVGAPAQTHALLTEADLDLAGPAERARLLLVPRDAIPGHSQPYPQVEDVVRAAGAARDAGVRDVAGTLLLQAAARCGVEEPGLSVRAALLAEIERWDPPADDPTALSVRAFAEPYRYGVDLLKHLDDTVPGDGRTAHYLGASALGLGEFSRSVPFLARAAAVWRRQGRLFLLARSLNSAGPRMWLGELARAGAEAGEGRALADETGERTVWLSLTATAALLAAITGRNSARSLIAEVRADNTVLYTHFAAMRARQAEGLLLLLEGHASEAYEVLRHVFLPGDPHFHSVSRWHVVPDLADAAVAAGMIEPARAVLAGLPAAARDLPSELLLSTFAYSRAVLADDAEAEQLYAESLAALPPGSVLLRARLHLHHGRWLRRHRRYLDARELLGLACDEFERIGAIPWAQAAREQLHATGSPNDRRPNAVKQLSAQETQIAVLASQGLSNRDIGRRLLISHRTVGSHLYRIYTRLDITGRAQLPAALSALEPRSAVIGARRAAGEGRPRPGDDLVVHREGSASGPDDENVTHISVAA
ncbi:AAA family ATPase [Paractinoplanes hotanensis]|uniref:AAA family ATPase n=1 Tax=Paractinoplanes hotanensis TaxID=2906497 RepID=A0ABT0Y8C0_9ACTN|nr:LuxR family transcriptional regulator [Actinoplanes hotanensis]MCM4082298.1 AAA family ATPase [Actinoplanes hotanensis]